MSADCCEPQTSIAPSPRFRRALWIALWVNAAMFAVEIGGGLHASSVSLLADASDFFGDAANYALSLAVLSLGVLWRARAALAKGITMAVYGVLIIAQAGWSAASGAAPEPIAMGAIALLALAANVGVAVLLYRFREGDANMRSVWLCSRNDAIGNLAVLLAAFGVFGTAQAWPDLIVATIMAILALLAAVAVIRQARREIKAHVAPGLVDPHRS